MLTLTLNAIRDKDKNVTGFLCDQKDEEFALAIQRINDIIPRDEPETLAKLDEQVRLLTELAVQSQEQRIYTTHEYLNGSTLESWNVTKQQVINSHIHYCGLRRRVVK